MENEVNRRLKAFLKSQKITQKDFCDTIGLSIDTLKTIFKRDSDISIEILSNAVRSYPDLNTDWLLIGKGEMKRTQSEDVYKDKYYSLLEENNRILNELNEVRKENARLLGGKGVGNAPIARAGGEK